MAMEEEEEQQEETTAIKFRNANNHVASFQLCYFAYYKFQAKLRY
jgi:hypothetical protein